MMMMMMMMTVMMMMSFRPDLNAWLVNLLAL
jgi:hypothetical protein